MQFNPGDGSGIVDEIDALCDSDSTSYPISAKTRRVNTALEYCVAKILGADGVWQWDDSNHTDLPIGTQTLVADQVNYTFNDKFLQLLAVEVKDASGVWRIIQPIDQKEYSDLDLLSEDYRTSGLPEYYDKISDDTISLYPAPSASECTLASGLRIKFKRTASLMTTALTTTVPGIPSPYHILLCYLASIPYCMTYKKDRVALYEKKADDLTKELIEHYANREKDKRKQMTMATRCYK